MRYVSKQIYGAALALAASSASAQTSVTLYGAADAFVQYLNNGHASISERSGGSSASMVGLRGSEDLGGKLSAIFDMEAGYTISNGGYFVDNTSLFYRQAWIGLKHDDYGSLTFGRQYQPSFWAVYPTEPFRANEVLSPLAAFDLSGASDRSTLATQYAAGRLSNSIFYQSPTLYGVKLYGMYAFPATATQPVPSTTGHTLDVAATYQGAGLYVTLAYLNQHAGTETLQLAPAPLGATTFSLVGTQHFTGAIAYRIGIVNLQFNYTYARPNDVAPGSMVSVVPGRLSLPLNSIAHSLSYMELGATIQATTADTIELAVLERNVRGAHDNSVGYQVGVDHNLSKRTSVYARAGYIRNNGTATVSWPGITGSNAGASQTLVALGMSHRF